MSICTFNEEVEYKVRDDFEYHLGKKCLQTMNKYSDRIHQYNFTDDISETHGSVRLRSIRVAQALIARGVEPNDVIMLSGPNHKDVSIPLIASLYIGAATFPIPGIQTKAELLHLLRLGLPKIAFCQDTQAQAIAEAAKEIDLNLEIIVFGDNPIEKYLSFSEFSKPTGTEDTFNVVEFDPETTIALICNSSGTTGLPKGTCLCHKQLALVLLLPTAPFDPDSVASEKILHFANQFWISGSMIVLMSCVLGQTRVQTPLEFTSDLALEGIRKTKPNLIVLTAMTASKLAAHPDFQKTDLSCIKMILVLGSAISDDLRNELQRQIPNGQVNNNYGMTECAGPMCVLPLKRRKLKTIGLMLPWIQWRVINIDTGEALGPHEVGELQTFGDTIFKEYYKNPVATEEAFTSDKWYRTGDLVYFDEDKFIFPVDRIKEIIKYYGNQIAPAEIEHVIGKIEGVAAVCVVGLPMEIVGDLPLAFVQKSAGSEVTAQKIKDAVRDSLSEWKQLRGGVFFLDPLPLTYSGKIDRKFLNTIKSSINPE